MEHLYPKMCDCFYILLRFLKEFTYFSLEDFKLERGAHIFMFRKIILTAINLLIIHSAAHSQIIINEIQAKNIDTIQDVDGDYSDWIEFYNASDSLLSLAGLKINDSNNTDQAWQFPDIFLTTEI